MSLKFLLLIFKLCLSLKPYKDRIDATNISVTMLSEEPEGDKAYVMNLFCGR